MRAQSSCWKNGFILATVLLTGRAAAAEPAMNVSVPGASVSYQGLPKPYADAMASVLATARQVYIERFHCDMPATVHLTATVDSSRATALWNDGGENVTMVLRQQADLAQPGRSGYFQLYGLCHELGHLAMYRRCRVLGLPDGVGEGWADYAGSVVTDQVYARLGRNVWPDAYDYRADGLARLKKRSANTSADASDRVAAAFYRAHARYGAARLFAAMNSATESQPQGADVMPRFVAALAKATGDPAARTLFPAEVLRPTVKRRNAPARLTAGNVAGMRVAKADGGAWLRYDDGKSSNMRSTAGSGHAVAFSRPAGATTVNSVRFYGMRYGAPTPPAQIYTLYLLDDAFNVIKEIHVAYSTLTYGDTPEWNQVNFDPVKVPARFYVCLYFDPSENDGFFLHFVTTRNPGHAFAAMPGTFLTGCEQGWMVRVRAR